MSTARWALPAAMFLAAAAYLPGLPGAAFAPRWDSLWIIGAVFLLIAHPRVTPIHWLGAALVTLAFVSLTWSGEVLDWSHAMLKLTAMAGIFLAAAELEDARPVYWAYIVGVSLSAPIALAQIAGWWPWPEIASPSGLFVNRNFMGEAASIAVIAGAFLAPRFAGSVVPALVLALSYSRGAVVGVCIPLLLMVRIKRIALVAIVVGLAAFFAWDFQDLTRQSSLDMRTAIWSDTWDGLTWRGHGWGSFYQEFPEAATRFDLAHQRPEQAHNEYLQLAFELGPLGLALFLAFAALAVGYAAPLERAILLALLVESLIAFPLQNPATACVFALAAGRAAARMHLGVHAEPSRGMALLARLCRSLRLGGVDIEDGDGIVDISARPQPAPRSR